ncbi:hypothetical protein MIND_01305800 [Mycena indigotica]|uniref:Uncharacterized protein n=1 Tax=Mycena indigotica TaxID=2126181 RepID=A0A8H6S1T2_9AGAR|nr:uncharacterized protein MIND_01305800 [Mycena indigotica]KAF7290655.1 hypothetical protein MIND_01305800 [Mycena indigotica]
MAANHDLGRYIPQIGSFAVLTVDPVACVDYLEDPEATAACALLTSKGYVVYVPGTGDPERLRFSPSLFSQPLLWHATGDSQRRALPLGTRRPELAGLVTIKNQAMRQSALQSHLQALLAGDVPAAESSTANHGDGEAMDWEDEEEDERVADSEEAPALAPSTPIQVALPTRISNARQSSKASVADAWNTLLPELEAPWAAFHTATYAAPPTHIAASIHHSLRSGMHILHSLHCAMPLSHSHADCFDSDLQLQISLCDPRRKRGLPCISSATPHRRIHRPSRALPGRLFICVADTMFSLNRNPVLSPPTPSDRASLKRFYGPATSEIAFNRMLMHY